MKNFFLNSFLSVSLLFTACTKEARDTAVDALSGQETLLAKMNQIEGADSYVILSSETTGLGPKKKSYRIDASVGDKQLAIYDNITLNNNIKLKRYIPKQESSNQFIRDRVIQPEEYAQLFGSTLEVSMNTNPNQILEARTSSTGTVSTPTEIEVNTPIGTPNTSNRSIRVSRNVPLRWNPDPNNRSVYILVLFDPQDVTNFRYRNARRKTAFHTVRDNGNFTLPASDFEGIPAGGHLEILIARGNTALVGASSNGMGSTALTAYSMATINANTGGSSCGDCIEVFP